MHVKVKGSPISNPALFWTGRARCQQGKELPLPILFFIEQEWQGLRRGWCWGMNVSTPFEVKAGKILVVADFRRAGSRIRLNSQLTTGG
jgi:hypothetical protein